MGRQGVGGMGLARLGVGGMVGWGFSKEILGNSGEGGGMTV